MKTELEKKAGSAEITALKLYLDDATQQNT